MPAVGSLLVASLEGLLFGAGTVCFGVLAVKLGLPPVHRYLYVYTSPGPSVPAAAMSLVCALLFVIWFMSTSGAVQFALTFGALTGFALAVLGWTLLRRRGQGRTTHL
jgi:hypothetical protein